MKKIKSIYMTSGVLCAPHIRLIKGYVFVKNNWKKLIIKFEFSEEFHHEGIDIKKVVRKCVFVFLKNYLVILNIEYYKYKILIMFSHYNIFRAGLKVSMKMPGLFCAQFKVTILVSACCFMIFRKVQINDACNCKYFKKIITICVTVINYCIQF